MRKETSVLLFLVLILASLSFISAVPGIPHQFYGSVIVNGEPAPDNNIIVAMIDGDSYATVTKDGNYGFSPNIFYVEDPNGDRANKVINFYIGGKPAGSIPFANNGFTKLDFSLETTCGDNYCLGDETCSNCQVDCGVCMDPPVITIHSPVDKTYNTTKVNLEVSADQNIIVWMYALNSESLVTFTPNIILTAQEGVNNVTVVGINQAFQSGSSVVSFTVELPVEFCGDGTCNAGETCSTCSQDCGTCSSSSSSSGGGGGSSSGGGGIIIPPKTNQTNDTVLTFEDFEGEEETETSEEETTGEIQKEEQKGFMSGILGSVVGLRDRINTPLAIIGVIFVVGIIIFIIIFSFARQRKRKNQEISPISE